MTSDRGHRLVHLSEHGLDYSLRRRYVDDFLLRYAASLPRGGITLNVGGFRQFKRGIFDIDRYGLRVVHMDLTRDREPHVQADAAETPFPEGHFDAVLCSEVLEHVFDPRAVLAEIHRVLTPSGVLLLCVPFLNRIHADPDDFGRYTDSYWRRSLADVGFTSVTIEPHGHFWSVLADMIRDAAYHSSFNGRLRMPIVRRLASAAIGRFKKYAVRADKRVAMNGNRVLRAYTTGFGIRAVKS